MTDVDVRPRFAEIPVGEIAVTLPGATAVFRKLKLDYCCGGSISLAAAAGKRGLDVAEIEQKLATLVAQPTDLPEETDALIAHILTRYHEVHRREIPELIQLAKRVERVHAEHPDAPAGLADLLEVMLCELTVHMQKEENILFPMMRDGQTMLFGPIDVMRGEHDEHGETLAARTQDFQPPPGSCGSWRALYNGCRKLSDDLMEHIHIENNILFPRFA
jgi:regulator of cell morphogenesis and NO signaling